MSSPVSYDLQGQGGGIVLEASDSASGKFRWIQVLTDTVFSDIQSSNVSGSNSKIVGNTIPAGVGIGGNFTNIEIGIGLIIAYYA